MTLPIPFDYAPMEAETASRLPRGDDWLYEPKWDGFRCLAFRDGDRVELRSKAGKPLGRYFPDVVEAIQATRAPRFVLDGEIVIAVDGAISFDDLLLRIHPAASRVKLLATETPADLICFDLLVDAKAEDLTGEPLRARKQALERFARSALKKSPRLHLSPSTDDFAIASKWLEEGAGGLDGVIAKRADAAYASGDRSAMVKVKRTRTADCVVGGFRWSKSGNEIGSLLLGLYGADGRLHHVGFCSALSAEKKKEAREKLEPLRGGEGFGGRAPVGKSRWRKEGTGAWEPLRPELVVEVEYDHFNQGRFRHGTRFVRWRPDKAPTQCLMDQVEKEGANALKML
ncbi:MAG TPA: ATP-dependent DNA ligase [Longimicrobiaceae bacterium]